MNETKRARLEAAARAMDSWTNIDPADVLELLEENARLAAELTDIRRTMAECGIGDYKTWREAQDECYRVILAMGQERDTFLRQLTDSFATDLVDIESGPPPVQSLAMEWYQEYHQHLKDMLAWMEHKRQMHADQSSDAATPRDAAERGESEGE